MRFLKGVCVKEEEERGRGGEKKGRGEDSLQQKGWRERRRGEKGEGRT